VVLGLILDFFGVSILILVTLFGGWHQKVYTAKWRERYYWNEWVVVFNTFPPKLRKQFMHGFIPPKHLWNLIGFLFIGTGFLLQILGNLR